MTISFDKEPPHGSFNRIPQQPMVGKPCIRGMRVTVGMVVGQIGTSHRVDEILTDFLYLERDDIMQALPYAAWRADEREVMLGATLRDLDNFEELKSEV